MLDNLYKHNIKLPQKKQTNKQNLVTKTKTTQYQVIYDLGEKKRKQTQQTHVFNEIPTHTRKKISENTIKILIVILIEYNWSKAYTLYDIM